MIVEERVYTMTPGGVHRYVELWNAHGREAQIHCLGTPLGVYTCEVGASTQPSIRIRAVETLGRNQASGKLKRFVPLQAR